MFTVSRLVSNTALLCALATIGGDAFAKDRNNVAPVATGVAFGKFNISESDLAVTHAVLLRLKPTKIYMGASGERQTRTYTNGDFFSANLKPGIYSVVGFFSGNKFFALDGSLKHNRFRVDSGSAVYAGTYKLRLKKGGFLGKDKGTFDRIDNAEDEAALRTWVAREMRKERSN